MQFVYLAKVTFIWKEHKAAFSMQLFICKWYDNMHKASHMNTCLMLICAKAQISPCISCIMSVSLKHLDPKDLGLLVYLAALCWWITSWPASCVSCFSGPVMAQTGLQILCRLLLTFSCHLSPEESQWLHGQRFIPRSLSPLWVKFYQGHVWKSFRLPAEEMVSSLASRFLSTIL